MWIAVGVTLVALCGLLVAEKVDSDKMRWATKPVASTAFIATAVLAGALESPYGVAIAAGLVLSWWGDVLLIPRHRQRLFQLGIAAFLLGHVAYSVAFVTRGVERVWTLGAAVVMVVAAGVVLKWLWPHVGAEMKGAVLAYVVVISVMVALAVGTVAAHGSPMILVGAVMFYLSDLSVARERFVERGFINRIWGLPFYYVAQLILAGTVLL